MKIYCGCFVRLRENSSASLQSKRQSDTPSLFVLENMKPLFPEHSTEVTGSMTEVEQRIMKALLQRIRIGALQAQLSRKPRGRKMSTLPAIFKCMAFQCVEGEHIKTVFHKMCFSLNLNPPPKIQKVIRLILKFFVYLNVCG